MSLAAYVTVALASTLKFIGGPVAGTALGLSTVEIALASAAGMMLTVTVVTFAGGAIGAVWRRVRGRFKTEPPRVFSKRARRVVRIWRKTGLVGVALLTPIFLSPPLGTIVALSFKAKRPALFAWMLISAVAWGFAYAVVAARIPAVFGG